MLFRSIVQCYRPTVALHDGSLVHHAATGTSALFRSLLETHRRLTGVSGLVNVPLGSPAGLAASPTEAIRLAFGSAVDVLTMGRFLVGKDYWLLRSQPR